MDISEGIRRFGIVIFGVAFLILVATVFDAASSAIGTVVKYTHEDEPRLYSEQTGHDAWEEAQDKLRNMSPSERLSTYQSLFSKGNAQITNADEKNLPDWMVEDATRHVYKKILDDYFAAHPSAKMARVRYWQSAQATLVVGLVLSSAVAAIGWIILGFSRRAARRYPNGE